MAEHDELRRIAGTPMPIPLAAAHRPGARRWGAETPSRSAVFPVSSTLSAVTTAAAPSSAMATAAAAAAAILVYRYTGEPDLLIGWVDATRVRPLRLTLRPDQPIVELLEAVTAELADDGAPRLAMDELAELRDPTGAEHGPVCHAVVRTEQTGYPLESCLGCADLVLTLDNGARRTRLTVAGDEALFGRATFDQLAEHLNVLLDAVLAEQQPARSIDDVALLGQDELNRAIFSWNDTDEPLPAGHFPELVERIATDNPDSVAVVHADQVTTYGEFDLAANQLANQLRAMGVRECQRVAVLFDRCAFNLVAQLAIFKAGAAVVLLDPGHPARALSAMLTDSAAVAVLTDEANTDRLPEAGAPDRILLDRDGQRWRSQPTTNPKGLITDETISHIAYTSGSTGRPKAVALRHGALRNTIHVLHQDCAMTPTVRGSWVTPPGRGLIEVDCFPILAAGGSVHIPGDSIAAAPVELRDWLLDQQITHTLQPTLVAERLWSLDWPADCALTAMLVAGERVHGWPSPRLPFDVLNVYGSSEANVVATCDLTATAASLSADQRAYQRPPIGRPIPNVRMYVLDSRLRPLPPGVVGELCVSGISLSAGYLTPVPGTPQRFLPNPFDEDPCPVLYRTGDLARYWHTGVVEVVGRADREVKIRGYRTDPAEVESVLATLPGVRRCAVLSRATTSGELGLIAYVETEAGSAPRHGALRQALASRLPSRLVPSRFVFGPIALGPDGAVDPATLPAPSNRRPELDTAYQAATDPLELLLAPLWAELLELDTVGVQDDFFELGGDSLLAAKMLAILRERYDITLSMAELLDAPTVARAARAIGEPGLTIATDPAGRYRPFPLTDGQRALWHAVGRSPLGAADGIDYYEWERHDLHLDRFLAAWRLVSARHDALRTRIRPDGSQVVGLSVPRSTVLDLSRSTRADALRDAEHVRSDLLANGIDRQDACLNRLALTLLPGNRTRIHLVLHRLAVDADSAHRLLLPELAASYANPHIRGREPELRFRDYTVDPVAAWEALSSRDHLEGVPDDPPPTDTSRPLVRASLLSADAFAGLRHRAGELRVPVDALLTAALSAALRANPPVGRGGAAGVRPRLARRVFARASLHPDIDRVVGCFSSVLAVADPGVGDIADHARRIARQNPVDRTDAAVASGTRAGPAVLATVLVENVPKRVRTELGELVYLVSRSPYAPVDVRMVADGEGMRVNWTCSAVIPRAWLDAAATGFTHLLHQFLAGETT